ncbi:MAG: hypothetical protein E1N59_1524 [Puniceicoccaceae bacterium 5H]|nr:MAG: hypothetical protein E1N59_1524 [Puniceicoccaceae bacterium 5H]
MTAIPDWLHTLSLIWVCLGFVCAVVVALDEFRRPQKMWIMNIVWPATALYGTFLTLWAYFQYGTLGTKRAAMEAQQKGEDPPNMRFTPFPVMVGKGASHCGAGCTLGDIIAEWSAFLLPAIAVWFGYHSLFQEKIFAIWIFDYIIAWLIGVAFQYFTIKPMRNLSPGQGLLQAMKADTASITSWQVGMYGWMAIAHFAIFKHLWGVKLEVNSWEFWFMMQIAMHCGFLTAYPVNWLLVRKGVKEKM